MCWSVVAKVLIFITGLAPLYISNGASPSDLQLYMAGDVDEFDFWYPTHSDQKYQRWSKVHNKRVKPSSNDDFTSSLPVVPTTVTATTTSTISAVPTAASPTRKSAFATSSGIYLDDEISDTQWRWQLTICVASVFGALMVASSRLNYNPNQQTISRAKALIAAKGQLSKPSPFVFKEPLRNVASTNPLPPSPPPTTYPLPPSPVPTTTFLLPTTSPLGFFDFSALTTKPMPAPHPPTISPLAFFDFSALTTEKDTTLTRYVVVPPARRQIVPPAAAVPTDNATPPSAPSPPPPGSPITNQRRDFSSEPFAHQFPGRPGPARRGFNGDAPSFIPRFPTNGPANRGGMAPTGPRHNGPPIGHGPYQPPHRFQGPPGGTNGRPNNLPVYTTFEEFQRAHPDTGRKH